MFYKHIYCFIKLFLMLTFFLRESSTSHDLHHSIESLKTLWLSEVETNNHINGLLHQVSHLQSLLASYQHSWQQVSQGRDAQIVEMDPIASYSLLKHIGERWTEIDRFLENSTIVNTMKKLSSRPDIHQLPNQNDIEGSTKAIIRLLHVYKLRVEDLVSPFEDSQKRLPLLNSDLMTDIGWSAVQKGYLNVGIQVLQSALQTLQDKGCYEQHTNKFTTQDIVLKINTAVSLHDHVLEIQGPRTEHHVTALTPYDISSRTNTSLPDISMPMNCKCDCGTEYSKSIRRYEEEDLDTQIKKTAILGTHYLALHDNATWMSRYRTVIERSQVEALCRGTDLRNEKEKGSLYCKYDTNNQPWLRIAPFKMEILSISPYIIQVYDVIKEDPAKTIMKDIQIKKYGLSSPKLQVAHPDRSTLSLKNIWQNEETDADLELLTRKLEYLSGTNIRNNMSEPYMIANYGLGGEYPPHRDTINFHGGPYKKQSILKLNSKLGERMATALTYLRAPKAGGYTVFPWIGLSIKPVEGSTLIWWNLLSSGEHDFLTRHAACPVITGTKWVATKWISYYPQWNKITCNSRLHTKLPE